MGRIVVGIGQVDTLQFTAPPAESYPGCARVLRGLAAPSAAVVTRAQGGGFCPPADADPFLPAATAGLSGENILAMLTCVILPENELKSSCADLIRVSTSLSLPSQGVDAHGSSPWAEGPRDKPGQD